MAASENPSPYDVFHQVPGWQPSRLAEARALVVGAGALGNEVLKNLALLGVGEVSIVDFDRVETGNLSRSVLFRGTDIGRFKAEVAAERLREIHPGLVVEPIVGDILCDVGLAHIQSQDMIFGCVDNRLARLWLNRWAFRAGKAWISGGILNLSGQVSHYAIDKACYECGLSPAAWKDIQARLGCTDMAMRYFNQGQQPTTPISASIMGAVMVQEGLKSLFGQEEEALQGQMWSYEGQQLHAAVYDFSPPKDGCESHFRYPEALQIPGLSSAMAVGDWLEAVQKSIGEEVRIQLDHAVCLEIASLQSKRRHPLVKSVVKLSESLLERYREIPGEAIGIPPGKLVSQLGHDFPHLTHSLNDLGIPSNHILRVIGRRGNYYVQTDRKA